MTELIDIDIEGIEAYWDKTGREVNQQIRELITEMCDEIGVVIADYIIEEEIPAIPLAMVRLANRLYGTWLAWVSEEAEEGIAQDQQDTVGKDG